MPRAFAFLLVRPRLLWVLILVFAGLPVFASDAYVRVNQIGYEVGQPMRAYLMANASASGAKFVVTDLPGNVIASGTVGLRSGTWGSFSVYPVDFSISAAGSYKISVTGAFTTASHTIRVDTPANLYSQALANNLYFYENERDGANFISTPLRTAAGHLNDAAATVYSTPSFDDDDNIVGSLAPTGATINAEGGWWDAGDYMKFVQTQSYVVDLMLIGVRDFPNPMGALSTTSDYTREGRFGLKWLQRMWDDRSRTLYYQSGLGVDFEDFDFLSDHDLWRLPQADDTVGGDDPQYQYIRNRPVFVAGAAGAKVSPNLAGRLAAGFAECFQVYEASNPSLAKNCLLAAEHVFDLADTAPSGNLLTVAPFDFYPEGEWRDDLELGATELYFALQRGNLPTNLPHSDPSYYLKSAAQWAHAYITGPGDGGDSLNLYDVSGLAHFELYRAIGLAGNPAGLAVSQADLIADLENQMDSQIAQANDPFGFGWNWGYGDSASHGAGLAVMAQEYFYLTGDPTYADYSRQWLGNISGMNAWGVTFTVGSGDVFPDCMQHQVANLAGSLNGEEPLLRGAVVEGPGSEPSWGILDGMMRCPANGVNVDKKFDANGVLYKDSVQTYTTNEPAIDLSASSFLMYAWRISGGPHARQ